MMEKRSYSSGIGLQRAFMTLLLLVWGTPIGIGSALAQTNSNDIVLYASETATRSGNWLTESDETAAGGFRIRYADEGGSKLTTPVANPLHYFELTFNAHAGTPYRLWVRGKADENSTNNDSAWVQFSDSVDENGVPIFRIGTDSATMFNIEDWRGFGLGQWGWNDNLFEGMGPLIHFASSGSHTIRVQLREDGLAIDQIVLSPQSFVNFSPGGGKYDTVILPKTPAPVNQPPQVSVSSTLTSGLAPLVVGFTSSTSDPDGYITSYSWVFGDGQTSLEMAPYHVFLTPGTYSVSLTVTDNGGASATAAITILVSNPPFAYTQFKVLHWNVAYGRGTDNVFDHNRQATWMANMNADLISLNEVPPADAQVYADLLMQKTGITWYHHWVPIKPGDSVGQQILSKFPLLNTGCLYMSYGRSVAQATVSIGGKTVNFFSTHLSYESSLWRFTQLAELSIWMAGFAEQRIIAGDFNVWNGTGEYSNITANHYDSWIQATNAGVAVSYPDNPEGKTRGGRIDFIFYSKFAGNLTLTEARMPDQRDLSNQNVQVIVGNSNDWGVRPSDHNFLVSTFDLS